MENQMLRIGLLVLSLGLTVTASLAEECLPGTGGAGAADAQLVLSRPSAGSVSKFFGEQFDELLNVKKLHDGVDFDDVTGDPVYAARGGVVVEAGQAKAEERSKVYLGNYIRIDHGGGISTGYGHLSGFSVQVGDCVRPGQEIGKVGSTGRSAGPHLHFQLLRGDVPEDPLPFIE
jgi:murein DD-endopeptidase MepM/ murein hydrolase activator NlpD